MTLPNNIASLKTVRRSLSVLADAFSRVFSGYPDKPFLGTTNSSALLLKNIAKPKRYLRKLSCHQKPDVYLELRRAALSQSGSSALAPQCETLKKDGIVKLEGFLSKDAQAFLNQYDFEALISDNGTEYQREWLPNSDLAYFMAINAQLIALMRDYYATPPFLRHPPAINRTAPLCAVDEVSPAGFNARYHYDTVNQLTAHVLLGHVDAQTSRMRYAKKSHRRNFVSLTSNDYWLHSSVVECQFECIDLTGNVGDVWVFDSNALHRMMAGPGTTRLHLHFNYTPGNDLAFDYAREVGVSAKSIRERLLRHEGNAPGIDFRAIEHYDAS